MLGSFDEVFKWAIRGSSTPLVLQMKGRVKGPTPEVDVESLDFGIISYGFRWGRSAGAGSYGWHRVTGAGPSCMASGPNVSCAMAEVRRYTKELTLSNLSEIPLRFSWRVPEDEEADPREFQVRGVRALAEMVHRSRGAKTESPSGGPASQIPGICRCLCTVPAQVLPQKGTVLPHGKQRVTVELVSHTVQKYQSHHLVLDIPGVASDQLSVPLRAECAVPRISLECNPLEFGNCFVRYLYKRSLKLTNQSKLPAKFEVLPQDNSSKGLALFTVEPSTGGIPAMGEQTVDVSLCTQTLGRVQLPVRIRIPGSRGRPLEFAIDARSMGPDLLFGAEGASPDALQPTAAINYGNVVVLDQHRHHLQVRMVARHPGVWCQCVCRRAAWAHFQDVAVHRFTTPASSLPTSSCSSRARTACSQWSPGRPIWSRGRA